MAAALGGLDGLGTFGALGGLGALGGFGALGALGGLPPLTEGATALDPLGVGATAPAVPTVAAGWAALGAGVVAGAVAGGAVGVGVGAVAGLAAVDAAGAGWVGSEPCPVEAGADGPRPGVAAGEGETLGDEPDAAGGATLVGEPEAVGAAGAASLITGSRMRKSVRRLSARPLALALSAMGRSGP